MSLLQEIGPVTAAGAALLIAFENRFREWLRRPQLKLEHNPDPGSRHLDLVTVGGGARGHNSYWLRLRVENQRGRRTAEDVEVLVTRWRLRGGSEAHLDARPLRWSNQDAGGGAPVTSLTAPPGIARHVDLLSLTPPHLLINCYGQEDEDELVAQAEDEGLQCPAALEVWPLPIDRRHEFSEGRYDLELAVCARDVDATLYSAVVEYDGRWRPGDELWEHLHVHQLTKL